MALHPEHSGFNSYAQRDWFLQSLVGMVDTSDIGLSFGVTLICGGMAISGVLISHQNYFAKFGDAFAGAIRGLDDAGRQEVVKGFQPAAKVSAAAEAPAFIHLEGVVLTGAGGVVAHAPLWRGRIDAVSGFVLGTQVT